MRSKYLPVAIAFFLCGLNLLTASWWPVPWTDEALFLDPAANWFFDGRFTSSLWPTQRFGEFWISNAPLYSLILAGWLKLFGFGLLPSRALNMAWQAVLIWLCLWWADRRLTFRPTQLVLLALLLALPNSAAFMARSGRYDMMACLLSVGLVLCLAEGRHVSPAVAMTGCLMPWINLPALAFSSAAVGWLVSRQRRWPMLVLHLGAGGLGFFCLLMFANRKLGGHRFLETLESLRAGATENAGGRLNLILENLFGFAADRFWIVWAPILAVGLFFCHRVKARPLEIPEVLQKWVWAGLSASIVSVFAYKLNILNCWMFTIPWAFVLSCWWGKAGRLGLPLLVAMACTLFILGLPLRLALGFGQLAQAEHNHQVIRKILPIEAGGVEKVVYAQWPFYYEVKNRNTLVIGPSFLGTGVSNDLASSWLLVSHEDSLPEIFRPLSMRIFAEANRETCPIQNIFPSFWDRFMSGQINRVPPVTIWGH